MRREVVIELNRQGQYIVDGHINNEPVRFVVDTGANRCSMTDEKADAIGLDWRNWKKTTSHTAGGPTESWSGTLHSVRIGDIEVTTGVSGGVLPDMDIRNADALLGMSFLSQIEFTQDDGVLILHDGTEETMAKDSSDRWWDKEDPDPKEEVEEMINESEIKRLRREEELSQAEHEAKLAELERRERTAKGMPETPVATGGGGQPTDPSVGGVLGLWWLSPGEAVSIGISAMLVVFFFGMGSIVSQSESEWYQTEAEIVAKYPGWDFIEIEECYEDSWGDTYCDYYYDIDCWADLDVNYFVDMIEYDREVNGYSVYSEPDYEGAELYCTDYVENETLAIGSTVTLWYDSEDPGDIRAYPPATAGWILFFCCVPIFLLILVVTLVNARFSNAPKNVYMTDSMGAVQIQSGHNVVHHHHHGGWRRGWFYGGGQRFGGRTSRRTRRVSSGGGRRGGGGRGGGGGRR